MTVSALSIRPFLGARDFSVSCSFYRDLVFEEKELGPGFSVFHLGSMSFYLQDAYVKDWVDNTQVFLEVDDLDAFWHQLEGLDLPSRYDGVRVEPVRVLPWGRECFIHDPSGILWHVGEFAPNV